MGRCIDEEEAVSFAHGHAVPQTQRLVEEHLDECSRCFEWVAGVVRTSMLKTQPGLAETLPSSDTTPEPSPPPDTDWMSLAPGALVGRYEIVAFLGAGAMGVVYRAHDPVLRRFVALKVIRGGHADGSGARRMRVRLLAEAHALARLQHRNVVTIHDLGFVGEQIFIAMELVEGTTLGQWQRGRPWREILSCYAEAARGLAAAHDSGLVHRDFKPDNVLVSGDRVVVTDFGLACTLDVGARQREAIVQVGTPAYMAPEQFRGDGSDERTDIFNFCAALYESLCGQPPFPGDSFVERRAAVLEGRARPMPSERRLPRWLRSTLWKGLSHHPDDRHQTMEAVIASLQHEARARRRRNRVAVVLALVVVAAGSAVVSIPRSPLAACRQRAHQLDGIWTADVKARVRAAFTKSALPFAENSYRTVESFLDRYAQTFAAAYGDACNAAHLDGRQSFDASDLRLACLEDRAASFTQLGNALVSADAATVTEAATGAAKLEPIGGCAELALLGAPLPPPRDPLVRIKIRQMRRRLAGAHGLELAARYDDARRIADESLTAARTIGFAPLEAEAWFRLGEIDHDRSRWADAEKSYANAIDAAERGRVDPLRAHAMTVMVEIVGHRQARLAEGDRWNHQAETVLARLGSPPREAAALALSRGLLRLRQARLVEAEADMRESLRLREGSLSAGDPELGLTLASLAIVVHSAGRYADAEGLYRRAHDQLAGALGAEHPRTTAVLGGLAGISYQLGRLKQARDEYERALAGQTRAFGPRHPNVANLLANIANVCDDLGDHAGAVTYSGRALAIVDATAPKSPEAAQMELNLALYLRGLGQFTRAHELLLSTGERRRELLGPKHALVGEVEYYVATVFLVERRLAEAAAHAKLALELVEPALGAEHPTVADILDALGVIDREQGRAAAALQKHRRALAIRNKAGGGPGLPATRTNLGLALLATGAVADARAEIENAMAWHDAHEGDPQIRAATVFALARALWPSHDQRARARALGAEALATFERGGPAFVADAHDVRTWLVSRVGNSRAPRLPRRPAREARRPRIAEGI